MKIDGVLDWILDSMTTLTQLVITLNYSAIANFQTLKITTAHATSFKVCRVFTSSCLVTVSNNDYFSASWLRSSLNGDSLPTA
jgi:hypothetical protein